MLSLGLKPLAQNVFAMLGKQAHMNNIFTASLHQIEMPSMCIFKTTKLHIFF